MFLVFFLSANSFEIVFNFAEVALSSIYLLHVVSYRFCCNLLWYLHFFYLGNSINFFLNLRNLYWENLFPELLLLATYSLLDYSMILLSCIFRPLRPVLKHHLLAEVFLELQDYLFFKISL